MKLSIINGHYLFILNRSAELSTTNELTEDTIDQPNHSQSHQNVGLAK